MNYQKVYDAIIQKRLDKPYVGYTEQHHIIPKSLGGSDDRSNLVNLSAREHFVCHLLLTKIYEHNTSAHCKMVKAFMMMCFCKSNNQQRHISSKNYEKLKEQFSAIQSTSQARNLNSQYGKPRTEETKLKIKQTLLKKYECSKRSQRAAKRLEREKEKVNTIDMYREYYRIYSQVGFEEFVSQTGYNKSKQNLVQRFSALLEEFKPQNGKRRGCKK